MKILKPIICLGLLLSTSNSFSFICTASKSRLRKLPEKLFTNFRYEAGPAQTRGPNFGLSKHQLENRIQLIQYCQSKINNIGLSQCLTKDILPVLEMRLRRRRSTEGWKRNTLAFEISDEDYFKYTPKEALKLPVELKDGLPANWRELASKNPNWTAIQYRSRTVANPPSPNRSYGRVLIQVDESPFEKWIQFTVPQKCAPGDIISASLGRTARCDDQGVYRIVPENYTGTYAQDELSSWPTHEKVERLVDYISIDKSQDPNKIYFSQYWRDENGKNPVRRDKAHGQGSFDTCYTCHPNGIRQISPAPGSVRKEDLDSFKQLTEKISGYNNLDWGPAINPKAYGPHLGAKQNCTSCHNNKESGRGALSYMTTRSHIDHKLHGDFSMNPVFRKSEEQFLSDMQNLSRYISEKDRQEIEDEIRRKTAEGRSEAYHIALDYLEQNSIPVSFQIDKYKEILQRLEKRNKRLSASKITSDIGTQFKETLLANCNTAIETSSTEEIYDENPAYIPFEVDQILQPDENQPGPVYEQ